MYPEPVRQPVKPDGVQPWITQQYFENTAGSGIAFEDNADILTNGF
jgi:hypothetical protein